MRRSTGIALISLLVSIVGVIIALAAYFKNRSEDIYDDYDFDDEDFFSDDYECECSCCEQPASIDEYENADIDFTATIPEEDSQNNSQEDSSSNT